MDSSAIVPLSLLITGVLGIGLSAPLLLNKVPRNRVYGFRTKLTLSSNEIWYPANRFAAKALIAWSIINLLIAIPFFFLLPLSDTVQFLLVIPPVAVLIPWWISRRWLEKNYNKEESNPPVVP